MIETDFPVSIFGSGQAQHGHWLILVKCGGVRGPGL